MGLRILGFRLQSMAVTTASSILFAERSSTLIDGADPALQSLVVYPRYEIGSISPSEARVKNLPSASIWLILRLHLNVRVAPAKGNQL